MTKKNKVITVVLAGALLATGVASIIFNSTTATVTHYPIKNFLGVDAHQWDLASHPQQAGKDQRTADLQNAILSTGISAIRIYSDATVIKSDDDSTYRFSPDGRGYEQDTAIALLKKAKPDLVIDYCYQNAPKNIQTLWDSAHKKSTQFRLPNSDLTIGSTWSMLGSNMAVIAARGGTNKNVSDYALYKSPNWWDTPQQMLKGSGLYNIAEAGNEYDNKYSNDDPLNGTQYAVMWKTIYDSVKKVDPNIIVSTTGVMTEDPKVLQDAIAWSDINNSGGPLFDEYQYHCYPWGWSKDIASALPPEMNMIPATKKVVAVGKPCFIGEWGFDLHYNSDMGVRPFNGHTGEEIRSWWIGRSILGFAATGLKRSFYYRMYQDYGLRNDSNSTIFETSSLFIKDDTDKITRRLSGDVFKQLSQYGDFVWDSTLIENDSEVVYRFSSGLKKLYMGWTVEGVSLVTVPNGAWTTNRAVFTERKLQYTLPKGTRLDLQPGDFMAAQSFAGGSVELSSKPVFVLVDGTTPIQPPPPPPPAKQVFYKTYAIINRQRYYYIMYTDNTWVHTNSKYVPM